MVLKDIQCGVCGCVREMILNGDECVVTATCKQCERETVHESICGGGCGVRYRFNDWEGVDFSGQVEALPPTAHCRDWKTGVETPVTQVVGGERTDAMAKFHGDRRLEKRDRIRHNQKARRGGNPLFFSSKTGTGEN